MRACKKLLEKWGHFVVKGVEVFCGRQAQTGLGGTKSTLGYQGYL